MDLSPLTPPGAAGTGVSLVLYTDICQSSRLVELYPQEYPAVLSRHDEITKAQLTGTISPTHGSETSWLMRVSHAANSRRAGVRRQRQVRRGNRPLVRLAESGARGSGL